MGTLMYVGFLERKEMAGVKLDLPSEHYSGKTYCIFYAFLCFAGTESWSNDGTFKDGKTYFRWLVTLCVICNCVYIQ